MAEITTPHEAPGRRHVYHLYSIQFESRARGARKEALLRSLVEEYGGRCWIQYVPACLSGVSRERGHRMGEYPVAEDIFRRKLISLSIGQP